MHISQPRLCDACQELLHARIATNPQASHQLIPCRHCASGVVVAAVAVLDGCIASWQLHGPLTEEAATLIAASYLDATAALGARIEQPAFQ